MSSPAVSILVPVYNGQAVLEESLTSIACQSFTEFEVIISDDCSSDASVNIARRWQQHDSRFRSITNKRNLGMTANWNRALREAKGRYVIKLDCDDAMRNRCVEELVTEMEHHPDVDTAFCRTVSCDENLNPYAPYLGDTGLVLSGWNPLERHCLRGHEWYEMSFSDIQLWSSAAQLHRRQTLLDLGGWDETWGCASDTDLILRVLEKDKYISHLPYEGIFYRHHGDSVSNDFRRQGSLVWEGTLLSLLSLSRFSDSGSRISFRLRKEWWRHWCNFQQLRRDSDINLFPEPIRTNIFGASKRVQRPPLNIVLLGRTRDSLAHLKRLIWKRFVHSYEPT